jgi:hypothetical protein
VLQLECLELPPNSTLDDGSIPLGRALSLCWHQATKGILPALELRIFGTLNDKARDLAKTAVLHQVALLLLFCLGAITCILATYRRKRNLDE